MTEALTTEQIDALKAEMPLWLQHERATQSEVRKEAVRIKEKQKQDAAKKAERAGAGRA